MARYQDHKSTGLSWWLIASLALYFVKDSLALADGTVLLAVAVGLPATLLGAGFPDLDLASSIPHRRFRCALFIVTTVLALWLLLTPEAQELIPKASWPVVPAGTLILALLAGGVAVTLLSLFLPPHRGITHRWPLGIIVALGLGMIVGFSLAAMNATRELSALVTLSVSAFFLLGFASHLYKDGMWRAKRRS